MPRTFLILALKVLCPGSRLSPRDQDSWSLYFPASHPIVRTQIVHTPNRAIFLTSGLHDCCFLPLECMRGTSVQARRSSHSLTSRETGWRQPGWTAPMPHSPGKEDNTRQSRERWVTPAEAQGPLLPLGRLSFHNTPQRLVGQTMEGSGRLQRTGFGHPGMDIPLW